MSDLTFISATWANEAKTCVCAITTERGAVLISSKDNPERWADFQASGVAIGAMPAQNQSAEDLVGINIILGERGSILRAIAEVQFRMLKGTLPVDATMTPAKYKTLLVSIMNGG